MTAAAWPRRASPLDRLLRLFTEVRAGEGLTAVVLAANLFLILAAYYFIKPAREAFILAGEGAEVKSYAAAGQALLLLGLVPAYGWLADRLPRRRLLTVVTAFFVACLAGFFVLARLQAPIGVVFFLWVGIFNLMMVAQFWSFANDVYRREEGERLFPIVAFGGSLGAVVGSALAGRLIASVGVAQLLPLAALLLLAALALSWIADHRERVRTEAHLPPMLTSGEIPAATGEFEIQTTDQRQLTVSAPGTPGAGRRGSFVLVFRDSYLLLIALLLLVLNWVNTTGEYILGRTVAAAAEASAAATGGDAGAVIGQFYSDFFFAVNLAGVLLQLFVVSRIIKYLGVRIAVLVLPLLAFAGYATLAFLPILAVVRWVKTAENATDYSLQNTVRNVLFLPTTREQKYKAKQAIDSFFVRAGDVLSAGLIWLGTTQLAFGTRDFALVNLVLAGVWLTLALAVGRSYARKAVR